MRTLEARFGSVLEAPRPHGPPPLPDLDVQHHCSPGRFQERYNMQRITPWALESSRLRVLILLYHYLQVLVSNRRHELVLVDHPSPPQNVGIRFRTPHASKCPLLLAISQKKDQLLLRGTYYTISLCVLSRYYEISCKQRITIVYGGFHNTRFRKHS